MKAKGRRGVYILPSLITSASLFLGFWSMILALNGRYESAVLAIYVALILDFLDGKVARMMSSETRFGAEYDSLSDVIVFGCAPAILLHQWIFFVTDTSWARVGWLLCFVFLSTTAMRLARFNAATSKDVRPFFLGLPCPIAAVFLVSLAGVCKDHGIDDEWLRWLMSASIVSVSILMVSNFGYYSFKEVKLGSRISLLAMFLLVSAFVLFSLDIQLFSLIVSSVYLVSPLPRSVIRLLKKQKPGDKTPKSDHFFDKD